MQTFIKRSLIAIWLAVAAAVWLGTDSIQDKSKASLTTGLPLNTVRTNFADHSRINRSAI